MNTLRRLFPSLLVLLAACAPDARGPNYPISDHYNGRHFFNPDGKQGSGGTERLHPFDILRDLFDPPHTAWPRSVPITPSIPPRRVNGETMHVTWIGHSSVLIQTEGLNILTDPVWAESASPVSFLGARRVRAPGIRLSDLPKIDLILISHDHYDHLDMPTMRLLWRRDHPLIVTGLGVDRILAADGIASVGRDWGQRVSVRPGIDVILDRVHHWSAREIGDRNKSLWTGFTVTLPGGDLYFAGDTGPGDMHWAIEAARNGPVRFALLPIGAYHFRGPPSGNHIGPDQAVTAFQQLGAGYALGVHWGTFELTSEAINEPPQHLVAALDRAHIARPRFRVLEAGGTWDVPTLARPPEARQVAR